ncbi:MAG TPA: BtpA/SgcQ family protein [Chthonomonadales bacterium]|nr:BtpA/SgcQ family protein [Chthonomonadales bacterium]
MATSATRAWEVKVAVLAVPVLAGSGVTVENVAQLLGADRAIVGIGLKKDGHVEAPVDAKRVKAVVAAVQKGC